MFVHRCSLFPRLLRSFVSLGNDFPKNSRYSRPRLLSQANGMSFQEYLTSLRKLDIKGTDSQRKLHVVLGNESCDLDSAVCSLVTGYYLSKTNNSTVLPVLSVPRCDFCLKTEVRCLLEEVAISSDSLIFLDDIDLADLQRRNLLELTLVDHNVLPHFLKSLEGAVVRIIDHHKWERENSRGIEKIWAMTGSCATLVGERMISHGKDILTPIVARLLQAAIIVDTVNFSESAKKTTPQDTAVFNELRSTFTPEVDWSAAFERLKRAKEDISALSVCHLLRKDLKIVREKISIAISSVPAALDEFLALPNLDEELECFRKRENVHSVVVMISKCYGDELRRWLVILGNDTRLTDTVVEKLKMFTSPSLRLEAIDTSTGPSRRGPFPISVLRQNNAECSRKVVLPILRELAANHS
ncbi:exopolyphosphatase PRUNE1 [Galendromus occidentalis]|uniref:Exopolyphosphatase PRUNE1 n=1 Tax=Galendromus occidentalis TaxID=34638 RepID=A0AAJ7L548_9ACAR|nr:exopolyphosphatase PRUNE1 [Galendromus occidentalis]